MQQVYGLNIDDLHKSLTLRHAATLAAQLPKNSRVKNRINPANSWGHQEYMLADIEHSLRWLVWERSSDRSNITKRPELRLAPGKKIQKTTNSVNADVDTYNKLLNQTWSEVQDGGESG